MFYIFSHGPSCFCIIYFKNLSFLLCSQCYLCHKLTIYVCFWAVFPIVFFSCFLIQQPLPAQVSHCLHFCNCKINLGIPLKVSHPLYFHVHLYFHAHLIGIFTGLSLNIGSVGKMDICDVRSSNSQYGITPHLVRFALRFLNKIL